MVGAKRHVSGMQAPSPCLAIIGCLKSAVHHIKVTFRYTRECRDDGSHRISQKIRYFLNNYNALSKGLMLYHHTWSQLQLFLRFKSDRYVMPSMLGIGARLVWSLFCPHCGQHMVYVDWYMLLQYYCSMLSSHPCHCMRIHLLSQRVVCSKCCDWLWCGNIFSQVCLCARVCLSVCLSCSAQIFESFDLKTSLFCRYIFRISRSDLMSRTWGQGRTSIIKCKHDWELSVFV